jgi:hypothetical protein
LSEVALIDEGKHLVEAAGNRNLVLRLLGALGIQYRCPGSWSIAERAGRTTGDIDLIGQGRQWSDLVSLFESLEYGVDERWAMLHGKDRLIFFHPTGFRVDVFLDKLNMAHVLELKERLPIHPVTVPLADLLLQKLQIVEFTSKDAIDILVLLREHPLGNDEIAINTPYLTGLLANDWGFWHTATKNLAHVRDEWLPDLEVLGDGDRNVVRDRLEELLKRVEGEPKTLKWKLRARLGTRVRWYQDVDEFRR